MLRRLVGRVRGFSATETSTVLTAVSIMTATAGPQLQEYLDVARMTKARGDIRVLSVSIVRLAEDVGRITMRRRQAVDRPDLLVTAGEAPKAGRPEAEPWTAPLDDRRVQDMSAHLVDNGAAYPIGGSAGERRWRGPYVEGLSADPWGCRYAANVTFLSRGGGFVTLVVSPGPDRVIETPFAMVGISPGGDDVVGLVWSGQ